MSVSFIEIVDGKEDKHFIVNKSLIAIPSKGDFLTGVLPSDYEYVVESVTHVNIFGDPGGHEIIVKIKKV